MPRTVSNRNERVYRKETWRPVTGMTRNDISIRGFVCEVWPISCSADSVEGMFL